jgi:hypothetical protein
MPFPLDPALTSSSSGRTIWSKRPVARCRACFARRGSLSGVAVASAVLSSKSGLPQRERLLCEPVRGASDTNSAPLNNSSLGSCAKVALVGYSTPLVPRGFFVVELAEREAEHKAPMKTKRNMRTLMEPPLMALPQPAKHSSLGRGQHRLPCKARTSVSQRLRLEQLWDRWYRPPCEGSEGALVNHALRVVVGTRLGGSKTST